MHSLRRKDGAMLSHMAADVEKRRFSVDEYYAMARAGILSVNDRVELIDGEILAMTPVGPVHATVVDRVGRMLMRGVGEQALVRVQNPIRLDAFTEPQPDVALLRLPDDPYIATHPQPADILLVVEVADSSLGYDRDVKASLYARAAIAEYWLVDPAATIVTCYASPETGTYREVVVRGRGQSIAPTALPDCTIRVDDLFRSVDKHR
jgi:Uma2 family endonuclease